jgi:hypothetical protein
VPISSSSPIAKRVAGGDALDEEVFDPSAGFMSGRSCFQALLCLLTGHCWGLALVFAGTSDPRAKQILLQHLRFMQWYVFLFGIAL